MFMVQTRRAKAPLSQRVSLEARKTFRHWQLYLLLVLPVAQLIIFKYVPIYGVQIAFREYSPVQGIMGSPWVGMKHFINFFSSHQFARLLTNTLSVGFWSLIITIPFSVILALSINESLSRRYAKVVQMVTYAPYFISVVIITSMIIQILAVRGGLLNSVRALFGLKAVNLMASPKAFLPIYVISNVWQAAGYNAVIFLAALAAVSPELYEAAKIDGANIYQKIRHIDLPSVLPTMVMMLILNAGSIINVGYEKVLLLQNKMNMDAADVINTYVYRMGITSAQYSYSSAIGLFNSVVALALLLMVNWVAKKYSETSLF